MPNPTLKTRLAAGELVRVFCAGRIPHPLVIEMFALAGGYDGFWIDQEHAAVTYDQIVTFALAARANSLDCFVRMAPTGYSQVTQNLEAGAGGVMAAQIHSLAEAEQFVRWAKFHPEGVRGINTSGRDADYTHKPPAQFVAGANREHLVAIQIESPAAVAAADKIAALSGVDMLFVGPADLSLTLGVVGQFHHERLWEAIAQVGTACRNQGKTWGAVVPDDKFAARAVEHGCRMLSIGNDILALRRGVEALKQSFGQHFGT
ncbi:MAG: host specificity protein [Planctomycetota bacterium]|nr:MAG: host specificity protein [Planctomycetota bacterium]